MFGRKKKIVPKCKRCETNHYNFQDCVEAEQKRQVVDVPVQWGSPPAGFREWGDRLDTLDYEGNIFWRRRED